jgi:hypothetical protein
MSVTLQFEFPSAGPKPEQQFDCPSAGLDPEQQFDLPSAGLEPEQQLLPSAGLEPEQQLFPSAGLEPEQQPPPSAALLPSQQPPPSAALLPLQQFPPGVDAEHPLLPLGTSALAIEGADANNMNAKSATRTTVPGTPKIVLLVSEFNIFKRVEHYFPII